MSYREDRGSRYESSIDSSGGGGGGRNSYKRFNRRPATPKPVEVGKQYEVEITEISRQGDGVAKVQGFVVFVKNGKVKHNVKVQVDRVGDRFATATLVE